MQKIDFKKTLKPLYVPLSQHFSIIDVPKMNFIKIDGNGPPESKAYANACAWLYSISYPIKFISKQTINKDYVVPPLEGLWWAEDISAFTQDRKEDWLWTMMIMQPDWITNDMFVQGLEKASRKLGEAPQSLRFVAYDEGLSVQILHIGPYSDEGPTIARMHDEFIPENGLVETGHHHEIYLSDPRKTAPEKLKTVLRQPVKRV